VNNSTTGPSRWRYLIGASLILIAVVTCGAFSVTQVYRFVPDIRFVAPGTHEMYLNKSGRYTVFYEYHSAVDGEVYSTGVYPSSISVRIESTSSPQSIKLSSDYSGSSSYSTPKYAGRSVLEFNIDRPGTYIFASEYSGSTAGPDIVFAVGQVNVLSVALKVLGIILGTWIIIGIGVFIIVRTLLKRRNAAKTASRLSPVG
jgi:hypothetical protein